MFAETKTGTLRLPFRALKGLGRAANATPGVTRKGFWGGGIGTETRFRLGEAAARRSRICEILPESPAVADFRWVNAYTALVYVV